MLEGWIGDRSNLPFPVILSLRSQLLRQPASTVLTVVALAASVALAGSVQLTTHSVSQALESTADALIGSADLEVGSVESGMADELVERLRTVPGVASASPVVEHTFRVSGGPLDGEAIRVVAMDLLYESEVRDYSVSSGGFQVRDPLRLVASPNTILVAHRLAERIGLEEGDPLRLRSAYGEHEVFVRGIVEGGLTEAYGGQIAVMDVYGIRDLLGLPTVDRIDVALAPDADLDAVAAALANAVGDQATVRRSSLRTNYADSILGTMNAATWITTLIGVLLALFVTYAVTSLTVDRRVEELALLRAAGMHGDTVARLIVLEILLLALPATLLGFGLAVWVSDPMIAVFSRASAYIQLVQIPNVEVTPTTLAVTLLVGLPVALLASLEPAWRAGRRPPLEVLRGNHVSPGAVRGRPVLLALAILTGLTSVSLTVWASDLAGPARLPLTMTLGIVAAGVGGMQLLMFGVRPLQRLVGAAVPRVGHLAFAFLVGRPVEAGTTFSIWVAVAGGLFAILSSIHSVTVTIDDYWTGLMGEDVVMVFAQDPMASQDRELIRAESIEAVRATPGVGDVIPLYGTRAIVEGQEVGVGNLDPDVLARRSDARSLSDDPMASLAALQRGELLMNEGFARHFGVSVGEEVALATHFGKRRIRVGGWCRAFYGGDTGSLLMSNEEFERLFEPAGSPQVAIWVDGPLEPVLAEMRARSSQALFFRYGDLFRRHTAIVMAKFNDLLMVPAGVVGLLGAIALLNLLVGNIIGRRRDLTVIRLAGGTRANLIAMILTNGMMVGLTGTAVGLIFGIGWSRVAGDALAEALGYGVVHHLDTGAALWIGLGGLLLAVFASVGPATAGSRSRRMQKYTLER